MPTVGDMIFNNEEEFKAYIDGYLITKKFFGEIEKELRNDIERHPKFCEGFCEEGSNMIFPSMEIVMKERNSKKEPTAETALFEKLASAFSAYLHGNKKESLNHFAQFGAIIFRCMEYIQKEMEAWT
jgi:anaerobic ribonucleoside-triphosphate reductase